MEVHVMIGYLLIGVGIIDYLIGNFVVLPKIKVEETKSKLRLAFTAASLLTIVLGSSFLLGWIGPAA